LAISCCRSCSSNTAAYRRKVETQLKNVFGKQTLANALFQLVTDQRKIISNHHGSDIPSIPLSGYSSKQRRLLITTKNI
jgi:hypothetical protein